MKRVDLDAAVDERRFGRRDVIAYLDSLSIPELTTVLGDFDEAVVEHAQSIGTWKPGDGRPTFADENPAVMAVIGRCASSRIGLGGKPSFLGSIHPTACDWCEMPIAELLLALDWFTWWSQLVVRDALFWKGAGTSVYARAKPIGWYANPRVAEFVALPREEQTRRVQNVIDTSALKEAGIL